MAVAVEGSVDGWQHLRVHLYIVNDLIQQQIQELVGVLMHGRAEHLVFLSQNLEKLEGTDDSCARLVTNDGLEYVLQRGKERLGHAVCVGVAHLHLQDWTRLHSHLFLVVRRVFVIRFGCLCFGRVW